MNHHRISTRRHAKLVLATLLVTGAAVGASVTPSQAATKAGKLKKTAVAVGITVGKPVSHASSGNPPKCGPGEVLRWEQTPAPGHYYCAPAPTTTTTAKEVLGI